MYINGYRYFNLAFLLHYYTGVREQAQKEQRPSRQESGNGWGRVGARSLVGDRVLFSSVLWHCCRVTGETSVLAHNKLNCVLSNTGLSNALTETDVCTSLKCDFYFRFHSPLNTKSALLNFIRVCDLVLICWKMWSPEPEKCQNRNPHTSKIGELLPVCVYSNRRRSDHICEPHAKFGENR